MPRLKDMELLLAQVWAFWIAPALLLPTILILAVIIGLYLKKVVAPRYPKR
ncbi:MAG: hypothetical protein WEA11_04720 [Acidimicrobiales bacterium]